MNLNSDDYYSCKNPSQVKYMPNNIPKIKIESSLSINFKIY